MRRVLPLVACVALVACEAPWGGSTGDRRSGLGADGPLEPIIASMRLAPVVPGSTRIILSATADHPGSASPRESLTWSVDWGDGTPVQRLRNGAGGRDVLHQYFDRSACGAAGWCTAELTVCNEDGLCTSRWETVPIGPPVVTGEEAFCDFTCAGGFGWEEQSLAYIVEHCGLCDDRVVEICEDRGARRYSCEDISGDITARPTADNEPPSLSVWRPFDGALYSDDPQDIVLVLDLSAHLPQQAAAARAFAGHAFFPGEDNRLALVTLGGDAELRSSLTANPDSFDDDLDSLIPEARAPGVSLADALDLAMVVLGRAPARQAALPMIVLMSVHADPAAAGSLALAGERGIPIASFALGADNVAPDFEAAALASGGTHARVPQPANLEGRVRELLRVADDPILVFATATDDEGMLGVRVHTETHDGRVLPDAFDGVLPYVPRVPLPQDTIPLRLDLEVRAIDNNGNRTIENRHVVVPPQIRRPTIVGVEPGLAAPGDRVVIRGRYFSPAVGGNIVALGAVEAAPTRESRYEIEFVVPQGAEDGTVVVISEGIPSNAFPFRIDCDRDGLPDNDELAAGTDPKNPDTDGDGVLDGDDLCPDTQPDADGVYRVDATGCPRCLNGQQDGAETGVDCGGDCDGCPLGETCGVDADCAAGECVNGICAEGNCSDGFRSGSETGVDCGGRCPGCPPGEPCEDGDDCEDGICRGGICIEDHCDDGIFSGDETDVDCGGSCQPCPPETPCERPTDCDTRYCFRGVCRAAPSCLTIQRGDPSAPSGAYSLRPDIAVAEKRVYCDMTTDGGGWTLVGASAGATLNDRALDYHEALVDLEPSAMHAGIWDGMRPLIGRGFGDLRFGCKTDPADPAMTVDLSFYDVDWYREITSGQDADSCFAVGGVSAPARRDNLSGDTRERDEGTLEGEDRCDDAGDFTVDFDGLRWGELDGAHNCGATRPANGAWFVWMRESLATCDDGLRNGGEDDVDCGGPCDPCVGEPGCEIGAQCESGVCLRGQCQPPRCDDGRLNGAEEGVDCGGFCDPCAPDLCFDGIQNRDEVAVDCGGSHCRPCAASSCRAHLNNEPGLRSGVYLVGDAEVYCDMETDGGGWTLVGASYGEPLRDAGGDWYEDLATLFPAGGNRRIWDGLRDVAASHADLRFSCKRRPGADEMSVDLAFYDVGWYGEITQGADAASCFNPRNGAGAVAPERRNLLSGAHRARGEAFSSGTLEGEDECSDRADFSVDFDDRGIDSNEADGTDWGEDDGRPKCGVSDTPNAAWYLWVREAPDCCDFGTCENGMVDGDETGVDCGGSCPRCLPGNGCAGADDCESRVCTGVTCAAPTCVDGVLNGEESGLDCGGRDCAACAVGVSCREPGDCASGVCQGGVCVAPRCDDGLRNGTEVDVDCGGACPACANGERCGADADCSSGHCDRGTCVRDRCTNDVLDGDESDVDCGGDCAPCPEDGFCASPADCASKVCSAGACVAATSCADIQRQNPEAASGVYRVGGAEVHCDMEVDGGGWTLVAASSFTTLDDRVSAAYPGLASLDPPSHGPGVWGGLRDLPGVGGFDLRFACKVHHGDDKMAVDLSFYPEGWYEEITSGSDADSCFNVGGVSGMAPGRRDNIDGFSLPRHTPWRSDLSGEDSCGDSDDFAIDFDDAGIDGEELDGRDWGEDDGAAKCGFSYTDRGAWFIFARERLDGRAVEPETPACDDGLRNGDETDVDCGGGCLPCADGARCRLGHDCGSGVCFAAACVPAACGDGVANGGESDVDCGGPCGACGEGLGCEVAADCDSGNCRLGLCRPAGCGDASCGAPGCAPCPADSCLALLRAEPGTPSGRYRIAGEAVYCDMQTDGGGWTLVGSSRGRPLQDRSDSWHDDLGRARPRQSSNGVWGGLRDLVGASSDVRFTCRTAAQGESVKVDLSYYGVPWYREITSGEDADSCFSEGDGRGYDRPAPRRRNNLGGDERARGADWSAGFLEGEDACGDNLDFVVDFDTRGVDAPAGESTSWGEDDGEARCGAGTPVGGSWSIWVREGRPDCFDGVWGGDESDVDCGGSCPGCIDDQVCGGDSDCAPGTTCQAGRCAFDPCNDGVPSGDESDIDCGGSCAACAAGLACGDGEDCESSVCGDGICLPPSCNDGVSNGRESGIDCGGQCGPCPHDSRCDDGELGGDESDVDCGGSCPLCIDGAGCGDDSDCAGGLCRAGRCVPASCIDGLLSAGESDVDCGGGCGPCPLDGLCQLGRDCASGACREGRCRLPHSCREIAGSPSGVYRLASGDEVYCDMHTDGGGWTLVSSAAIEPPDDRGSAWHVGLTTLFPDVGGGGVWSGLGARVGGGGADLRFSCKGDRSQAAMDVDLSFYAVDWYTEVTAATDAESCFAVGGVPAPLRRDNLSGAEGRRGDAILEGEDSCGDRGDFAVGFDAAATWGERDGVPLCGAASPTDGAWFVWLREAAPDCADGVQGSDETDVDCGGLCERCADGLACALDSDCASGRCEAGVCADARCDDGIRNGAEIDTDCGGACDFCPAGARCHDGSGCESAVCVGGACAAARCDDGRLNGDELGVDCGGSCAPCAIDGCTAPGCPTGASCKAILEANPGLVSGTYRVGGEALYCDMETDGGGWTLVASSLGRPLSDEAGPHHEGLRGLVPAGPARGVWDGLRPAVGRIGDLRFACKRRISDADMSVDLSFYDVDWYREITTGSEAESCFNEGEGAGFEGPAPARRDNLSGALLAEGTDWAAGFLEGEDRCDDPADFMVDLDNRGIDASTDEPTAWGEDDGVARCGAGPTGSRAAWFLWVREQPDPPLDPCADGACDPPPDPPPVDPPPHVCDTPGCPTGASCLEILDADPDAPSGIYRLSGSERVYCDMQTDGGGWTLVSSSAVAPVDDVAQGYAGELTTLSPNDAMVGVWDGLRSHLTAAESDLRVSCRTDRLQPGMDVDLSFYAVDWYRQATTGSDAQSCIALPGAVAPSRRDNISGESRRRGLGIVRGEDNCDDTGDFALGFDGEVSWGEHDGSPRCDGDYPIDGAWFVWVRERPGADCVTCAAGERCQLAADCASGVCANGLCADATCDDGVTNGGETSVDCGGPCAPCVPGEACGVDADCDSGVCRAGQCLAPACDDGVRNGTEVGVDCGGTCAPCFLANTCLELLTHDPTTPSGVYEIAPGPGLAERRAVWCDMETDGGGWTRVGASRGQALKDQAGDWHEDLARATPTAPHAGVWDGLRGDIAGRSDLRVSCKIDPRDPQMDVDLSFYAVDWYREITTGTDAQSCFQEANGTGYDRPAPRRRNNLNGETRARGVDWSRGFLEGEDACDDEADFMLDFDDGGVDGNVHDETKWGAADSVNRCGGESPEQGAWYLWVREEAPSCRDGQQGEAESDVDCGGDCAPCELGDSCVADTGCDTGSCVAGLCAVDPCEGRCGGGCDLCVAGAACGAPEDCRSGVCEGGLCAEATCFDGVSNGEERGLDCGGPACGLCDAGEPCDGPWHCVSGVCDAGVCQAAECDDGVQNGTESGVDCGGALCPKCDNGLPCVADVDCDSDFCLLGECADQLCVNGALNPGESDVDCGGPCPDCATGQACEGPTDCRSRRCDQGLCIDAGTCDEILRHDPEAQDGVYPLLGGELYCDMSTAGGGWTLIASARQTPPGDRAADWHPGLTTLFPADGDGGVWSGLRSLPSTQRVDLRFSCKRDAEDHQMAVDLLFHEVDWYRTLTAGDDAASCFQVPGDAGTPPARRDLIGGDVRHRGAPWRTGALVGESSCGDDGDFTVDFDDAGINSDQRDGTDWGEDDGIAKCGRDFPTDGAWFIWLRE